MWPLEGKRKQTGIDGQFSLTECHCHKHFQPLAQRFTLQVIWADHTFSLPQPPWPERHYWSANPVGLQGQRLHTYAAKLFLERLLGKMRTEFLVTEYVGFLLKRQNTSFP